MKFEAELQFRPMNAHNLLNSKYYNRPAPTCFGPHRAVIKEHTIVQNRSLTFSAQL